ncbi:MAG: hypothetical protein WC822_03310 [Candidatus Paceibacterota bacterium]|jgi:hypothetical protein
MQKVLIFPGAFQWVKNYGSYDGVDIWLKEKSGQEIPMADYLIGHSLGASFILSHYNSNSNCKFILINPLIKKRSTINSLLCWLKFLNLEGIRSEKKVPKENWLFGFIQAFKLLKVDILGAIQKIPKENVIIIRGKNDVFFCDEESVKIIKNNNITLIEVESGHDWNEKIAEAVNKFINK